MPIQSNPPLCLGCRAKIAAKCRAVVGFAVLVAVFQHTRALSAPSQQSRNATLFEHGRWRCKATRHGLMAFSRLQEDLVSVSLDLLGEYSEAEVLLIRALVSQGDTVLDVGANIGGLSVAFARMVGDSGRVHAFEPRAETASFLRANVGHPYHRWTFVCKALCGPTCLCCALWFRLHPARAAPVLIVISPDTMMWVRR